MSLLLTLAGEIPQFGVEGDLVAVISARAFKFTDGESARTLWKGNGPSIKCTVFWPIYTFSSLVEGVPYDGAFVSQIHPNSLVLQGVYYGFASLGVIYALLLMLFTCVYFNKR